MAAARSRASASETPALRRPRRRPRAAAASTGVIMPSRYPIRPSHWAALHRRSGAVFAYNLRPCASARALVAAGARGGRYCPPEAARPRSSRPPVRGRVVIDIPPAGRRPSSAYPSRAVTPAQLAPPSEVENVVIYLKDAPAARGAAAARRHPPAQRDVRAARRRRAGGLRRWTFPNDDPIYHNVFSLSRARTFNLGRFPRGESRAVRFDKPGIVKVFCDIHSHMSAAVDRVQPSVVHGARRRRRLRDRRRAGRQPAADGVARAAGRHDAAASASSRAAAPPWSSCCRYRRSEAPAPARHTHHGRHVHHRGGHPVGGLHGAAGGRARSRPRQRNRRSCRSANAPSRGSRRSGSASRLAAISALRRTPTLKAALDTYFSERRSRVRAERAASADAGRCAETVSARSRAAGDAHVADVVATLDPDGRVFASGGPAAALLAGRAAAVQR